MDTPALTTLGETGIVILAFSALIFVHELGHYLAALLVGVRVERFFLGFDAWGMALKKEFRGCVYGIGIIPLGGYVKLAGQADDPREEKVTGPADELRSKPLWGQALIFAAGVLMNFVFAYVLLVFGYLYGIPFSPNILGALDPDGQAATYQLRSGDRILAINGTRISTFEEIQQKIFEAGGRDMLLAIERPGADGKPEAFERHILGVPNEGRGKITHIGAGQPISRIIAGVESYPE